MSTSRATSIDQLDRQDRYRLGQLAAIINQLRNQRTHLPRGVLRTLYRTRWEDEGRLDEGRATAKLNHDLQTLNTLGGIQRYPGYLSIRNPALLDELTAGIPGETR